MAIQLTRSNEFYVLTLSRPEAMNALNALTISEIDSALDEVEQSDARALLITGAGGKAFCGGADIKELRDASPRARIAAIRLGQSTFSRLERLPILSIAVVNGIALGGGLELALSCTFRIATPDAKFGLPEVKLGLIPGFGGTQRLPRLIGTTKALEIILTGRYIDANEALTLGLISAIASEDPLPEAEAFARRICTNSLRAVGLARDAVQRSLDLPIDEGMAMEADLIALAFESHDANEGMTAFIEKRKPRFTDS